MATAMPKPAEVITELRQVAVQIQETAEVDRDRILFGRTLSAMADQIEDDVKSTYLDEIGVPSEVIAATANALREWGGDINPQAQTQWKRDEVVAKVALLDAMAQLGMLDDKQIAELAEIRPILTAKPTKSGGVRTPQERIDGRPDRVVIKVAATGEQVSKQVGNTKTSVGNVKNAASRWYKSVNKLDKDATVPSDTMDGYLAAAKSVCENGKNSEFGDLLFEVA